MFRPSETARICACCTHDGVFAGAAWDRSALADVFAVPSLSDKHVVRNVVAYLARSRSITRIATVDDPGVDLAAHLREYLQLPGMNESEARKFRDELAMRTVARGAGIRVPAFSSLVNDQEIADFLERSSGPWLIKPRSEASSRGISRVNSAHEVWKTIEQLGDDRARYLIEQYVAGNVYHVDSVVHRQRVVFAEAHVYRKPLLDIVNSGGSMVTTTVTHGSERETLLLDTTEQVLSALGMKNGVNHTEIIIGQADGAPYFLESAARVGGAHIPELAEATTGVNLWAEYTKLELALEEYQSPVRQHRHGALMVGLAKQAHPDFRQFRGDEVALTLSQEPYQGGIVLCRDTSDEIARLVDTYEPLFLATLASTS